MAKAFDITNKRFGKLVAIKFVSRNKHNKSQWLCKCDCGNEKVILANSLLSNRTKSCGCGILRGKLSPRYKNGSYEHIEYQSWLAMKTRCLNKNYHQYKDYGGRGIKICDRWLGDSGFENFLEDMGEKPTNKHTLDRKYVNGNYEPENCRWATHVEQARNRQNNFHFGKLYRESQGIVSYRLFRERIRNGWPIDVAARQPVGKQGLRYNK